MLEVLISTNNKSLSKRLSLVVIIALVVVGALCLSVNYFIASRVAKIELEVKGQEIIASLADSLGHAIWRYDNEAIQTIGDAYFQNDFIAQLAVKGDDGKTLFEKMKGAQPAVSPMSGEVLYEDKVVGHVNIGLASDYNNSFDRQLFWTFSGTILILLSLLLVLRSLLLKRYLDNPLNQFINMVNAYAGGKTGAFQAGVPYVEFHPLVEVLQDMSSKIESHMKSLEAEIRTRKRTEKDLRSSRDYLENLTGSMGDVVLSIVMPERTISWIRDSLGTIGYTPEECIGKRTDFLYHDKAEFEAVGKKLEEALVQGKDVIYTEGYLKRKNGQIFAAEATLTPIKVDGEVVSLTGILRDVSPRKRAEEKVLLHQQRLKALASQLTIAEESERRRIATDLHDDVCQSLALVRMQLSAAQNKTTDSSLSSNLEEISQTLLQTLRDTRNLMADLSSPLINEIGLSAAIAQLLEEFVEKRHHLETELIDDGEFDSEVLDENVRALLFRNIRELLANILKHAQAQKVTIRIEQEGTNVKFLIQDDGIGFNPWAPASGNIRDGGFGLFSINERMADLGGKMEIFSRPGAGCRVALTVPVDGGISHQGGEET